MKQILVATVLLAAAVTAVKAQEPNARAAPPPSPEGSHSTRRRDDVPAPLTSPAAGSQAENPSEPLTTTGLAPQTGLITDLSRPTPGRAPSEPGSGLGASREAPDENPGADTRFRWGAAFRQSLLFLAVQHGYALTQPKTRRELGGNFFGDYARSVRSLHGWADGGKFFTNYVAHPMQGSMTGFVQIQNDPAGSRLRFGRSGKYWRSRSKALAWSAAWSTQFEVGPLSQASIGNVGRHGKQTYVDLVMTPTAGLGLLVAEDALDRHVIERLERQTRNSYVRIFSRVVLNPTRTAANLLRFKKPWHRDSGLR